MDEATGESESLMNVESFSQLPFIRRPKDNNPKPIRLFGKDFSTTTDQDDYSETKTKEEEEEEEEDQTGDDDGKYNNIITDNRRFECHYCFRNFPTSQALGGHQNAHKRERQLAKRGASSYFHHPDTNLHGYRHYPSWTSGTLTGARSYGGQASGPQSSAYFTRPSYGSQLGIWHLPPSASGVQGVYNANTVFTRNDFSSSSNSTLPSHQPQPSLPVADSSAQNRMSSSYRYGLSPNVQDHVSLDLHL